MPAKSIRYVALEGGGAVQSIEISRRVNLLPTPSYGDIRWAIYVASPRESATVYADAEGTIIGGDLSNTNRARQRDIQSPLISSLKRTNSVQVQNAFDLIAQHGSRKVALLGLA